MSYTLYMATTNTATASDTKAIELALGRILRMASRPTQPGDNAEYERCRRIILDTIADTQQ